MHLIEDWQQAKQYLKLGIVLKTNSFFCLWREIMQTIPVDVFYEPSVGRILLFLFF